MSVDQLRAALQKALDLMLGRCYGPHASDKTIARCWLEWSKEAEAALAAHGEFSDAAMAAASRRGRELSDSAPEVGA